MKKNSIVWGACWFNESVETLINFYSETIKSLSLLNINVYPVIFDAKIDHSIEDIRLIKNKIKNVIIISNKINIFPNKNYGVALIVKMAYDLKCKYVTVVDPDWCVEEFNSFIQNILFPLFNKEADIVIPDIGKAAGRSNLLIGQSCVNLFYPEYVNIIKTAFPGSFAGLTDKMFKLVSSSSYHFDWGGEWDIISLAIEKKYKLISLPVNVKNVRHRTNNSKIFDSYQIWKAILASDEIIDRFLNIEKYNYKYKGKNELYKKLTKCNLSALEQINLIDKSNPSETQKQLLYMILYPIASILKEIDSIPEIKKINRLPYSKKEINNMANIAICCAKSALLNSKKSIKEINKIARSLSGQLWSDWNDEKKELALNISMK